MKSSKALLIIILLLLIAAIFASSYLVLRTTVWSGRATSTSSSKIILENSYLFVSPLQAKADGLQKIRATIFLINSQGLGVGNHQVSLTSNPPSLSITEVQAITDDTGKAVFDLTSSTPGKFTLQASSNGTPIPQTVQLLFQ